MKYTGWRLNDCNVHAQAMRTFAGELREEGFTFVAMSPVSARAIREYTYHLPTDWLCLKVKFTGLTQTLGQL